MPPQSHRSWHEDLGCDLQDNTGDGWCCALHQNHQKLSHSKPKVLPETSQQNIEQSEETPVIQESTDETDSKEENVITRPLPEQEVNIKIEPITTDSHTNSA